jgi:predicted PurR-regulated permease PerM
MINHHAGKTETSDARPEFARRVLIVTVVVAGAAAFVLASDVFFLLFLAVLLAVLLRSAADALARYTGIGGGWALAVVVVAVVALLAGGAYAVSTLLAGQFEELSTELPRAVDRAKDYLRQREWGRRALDHVPSAEGLVFGGRGNAASTVASFFSTTLGVLGNLVVLAFFTLYLAASPRTYVDGLLRLVPPRHRPRVGQTLEAIGYHLRWWLIGRVIAMIVLGLIVGSGLWAVGVSQFLVLALIAAVLNSIPYIGSIAGALPGVLLALTQGPTAALWAIGVYVLAQSVDNYLVTPLVQNRTVNIPPVLSILSIVLAGALFGVLALIVATPLTVVILVAVKMLYVEDVLGDRLDVPGAQHRPVPA